jgi:hypothetical protein
MKFNNLLLVLLTTLFFSNCSITTTVEPAEVTVGQPVVIEPVLPVIELPVTDALQKMIPYTTSQVLNFQIHTNENLAYQAKPRESLRYIIQTKVDNVTRLINYEVMRVAILPNQDSLKCMMLSVNAYTKRFEVLIEDNLAKKWNYFYLDYDENNRFYLNKNASSNTVERVNQLTVNRIDYTDVYQVTNTQNDKLWFSLQQGVLKAELADGRTWHKK